jgi:hypothetical protein
VFGELLCGGDQQLADAVQRVMLAASKTERGLLDPTADLVDHDVGQPDGVEVVHHHGGVGKRDDQRACLAAPRIQRDHGHRGQPVWRPGPEPAVHRWEIAHPGRPAAVGFAGTPQPAQPTSSAVVWTTRCHSPLAISAARTSKPSRPSSLEADARLC